MFPYLVVIVYIRPYVHLTQLNKLKANYSVVYIFYAACLYSAELTNEARSHVIISYYTIYLDCGTHKTKDEFELIISCNSD